MRIGKPASLVISATLLFSAALAKTGSTMRQENQRRMEIIPFLGIASTE